MKLNKIVIIAMLITVIAMPIFAQQRGRGNPPDAPRNRPQYGLAEAEQDLKYLNLSDSEIEKITAILSKDYKTIEEKRATIIEAQARLSKLLLADNPDMNEIKSAIKVSTDCEYDMRLIQVERTIACRNLLGAQRWATVVRMSRGRNMFNEPGNRNSFFRNNENNSKLESLMEILKTIN